MTRINTHRFTHARTRTHTYARARAHTHTHTHYDTHAHTHTHTCPRTHARTHVRAHPRTHARRIDTHAQRIDTHARRIDTHVRTRTRRALRQRQLAERGTRSDDEVTMTKPGCAMFKSHMRTSLKLNAKPVRNSGISADGAMRRCVRRQPASERSNGTRQQAKSEVLCNYCRVLG